MNSGAMNELFLAYKNKKKFIKRRLKAFSEIFGSGDYDLFGELCFCLLTPQSKAVLCDRAVNNIKQKGLLLDGPSRSIRAQMKGVRFPNNKTEYLIAARELFKKNGCFCLKDKIDPGNIIKTREWLVKNVKGIGYKEASHFLRNIGFGRDIAILDVHILKNLKKYGVIKEIPSNISRATYLDIENKARLFAKKINIPLDELDLLFWSAQTGFIFK